ncbi:MAG: transposase, partial [Thermodesulfobacteriota bacterium]
CIHDRDCILGGIVDGEVRLQEPGIMVTNTWEQLEQRFPDMKIDAHVVMPNHIHGIIWLVRRAPRGCP